MKKQDVSLIPPKFVYEKDERFLPEERKWQSAPSAAMTEHGRIFCVYSADNHVADEQNTNYSVCAYSDDNGETFQLAFYAYHEYDVRMSETLLFMSPEGKLYHFWTQSYNYFDGRGGIWCAVCEEPDAEVPEFGEARRICDGFMADNPVVLRDGRWIFPASVWTHMESPYHPFPEYEKVSVWESKDCGKTIYYLGGTVDDDPSYTENTVYEKKDGTLVMLFRTAGGIRRACSEDGGITWTLPKAFVLPHPSARFMVSRFPSGTLFIVMHYRFQGRSHLTALLSEDDGETFGYPLLLDERSDVSYPSGNVRKDGRVVLAYDRERYDAKEIMLASFTEDDLRNGSFGEGSYTKKMVSVGGKTGGV